MGTWRHALPSLISNLGWNLYALAACTETERHYTKNPALPEWLAEEYRAAWKSLVDLALDDLRKSDDPLLVQPALAACAVGKGQLKLGALLVDLDQSEIDELLDERLAWSEQYKVSEPL